MFEFWNFVRYAVGQSAYKPGGHVVTAPSDEDRAITIHFRTDDFPNCDRCMDGYLLLAMEPCGECGRVG